MTKPSGRVLGVDIIPAQPPRGVSTIQGNFLSPAVQDSIKAFLQDPDRGRTLKPQVYSRSEETESDVAVDASLAKGYIERGRQVEIADEEDEAHAARTVDVVLSDMCEPWEQTDGFFTRTLSNPYRRMMNTSGMPFRDHAGSMVSHVSSLSSNSKQPSVHPSPIFASR